LGVGRGKDGGEESFELGGAFGLAELAGVEEEGDEEGVFA
jgi:hypothetical protein